MNDEIRTSDDWHKLLCPKIVILDPDGWDRSDYQFSFYEEKITKQEFNNRLCVSTVQYNLDHIHIER